MDRRSERRRIMEKKRKLRKLRFFLILIVLTIVSVFAFKLLDKNKSENQAASMKKLSKEEIDYSGYLIAPMLGNKNLGEIVSIIEYETNSLIGAHYPSFSRPNIDSENKSLVDKYIKEFKSVIETNAFDEEDYKYELSIDYKTYSPSNGIVSVSYDIFENASYMAHPDVKVETKLYDLEKDMELKLDDIMKGEYLNFVSEKTRDYFSSNEKYKDSINTEQFKEGIEALEENYSNFILKDDKIVFIFPKYSIFSGNLGTSEVEIGYEDLEDFINPELFQDISEEDKREVNEETDGDGKDLEEVEITIPKRNIDPNKPMVALTFDDGPNKETTVPILNILKKYDSAATFFILGNRASNNVEILKRMVEEGSEIGNHSYNHKELTKLSAEGVNEQIFSTQNVVKDLIGIEPKLMRPTYGSFNDDLKSRTDMPLVLWSIDTLDWKSRDARAVTNHVLENVRDGDIVLMHDIYDSTAQAVDLLVPQLIDRGYQLVTVSELYEARGESLKAGVSYSQSYKK